MQVAGFVLVGGRSSRMGSDKARLPVNSRLLVEEVAESVREVAGNVALVGESRKYQDLKLTCLDDLRPGAGPLAGIEAALAAERGDPNLIVACDIAGVSSALLDRLVTQSQIRRVSCVVARESNGTIHPLCGVWNRDCLPFVQDALDHGRFRVLDILTQVGAEFVYADCPIHNVNTPEEWGRWLNH